MIRRRTMMAEEAEKWKLIEEYTIDSETDRIVFDDILLQNYTKFRIVADIKTQTCSFWIFLNDNNSTGYKVGQLEYAVSGRRTIDWYLWENEDGILSTVWTGTVNGIEKNGSITDELKRSLPVRKILLKTLGGNMESGMVALYAG